MLKLQYVHHPFRFYRLFLLCSDSLSLSLDKWFVPTVRKQGLLFSFLIFIYKAFFDPEYFFSHYCSVRYYFLNPLQSFHEKD